MHMRLTGARVVSIVAAVAILAAGATVALGAQKAEKVTKVIPGSRVVEIPEAAHMVAEDNPKAFNAAVLEFLATQPKV